MAKNTGKELQKSPVDSIKVIMKTGSVQEQFKNALGKNSDLFVASLIDVYGGDSYLQQCDPLNVVQEALKAATLNLPINKSLGFAWIVPYNKSGKLMPNFQIGWKGYVQLAQRTGQYRYINAGEVYEGEYVGSDKITGAVDLSGEKKSDKVVGYFAFFQLLNGFSKAMYWTKEYVVAHAEKYSKSYDSQYSAWKTEFDKMAKKTVLSNLLRNYGVMTVQMSTAMSYENEPQSTEQVFDETVNAGANSGPVIDIDKETGEVMTDDGGAPTKEDLAKINETVSENKDRNPEFDE